MGVVDIMNYKFGNKLQIHSGRWPYRWDFNIMHNPTRVICFTIRSNAKVGRSTRIIAFTKTSITSIRSTQGLQIGAREIKITRDSNRCSISDSSRKPSAVNFHHLMKIY